MFDQTKPRRARRWPYLGPIDTSAPRRAESPVAAAMRTYRERFREDDAFITVGAAALGIEAGDDQ